MSYRSLCSPHSDLVSERTQDPPGAERVLLIPFRYLALAALSRLR
jgi:hypothetical protein